MPMASRADEDGTRHTAARRNAASGILTGAPSLRTRISLVLTALAAVLVMALGSLWLKQTRDSIHEEVTAATRVAEQWLTVAARELRADPPRWDRQRLLSHIEAVGRIRANELEVVDTAGRRHYLSPQSAYKAGRSAPGLFAAAVQPAFAARRIDAGELTLILRPDASRAVLDAWDDVVAMAGWAAILLAALFLAARYALDRALRPLDQVMAALDRTGRGCFDTRLPVFPSSELGRLAKAFNGMADRLEQAVRENVRLGSERALAARMRLRIDAERRDIARELHDELAQGITAVRALAGAIAQRTGDQPALRGQAQHIVDVTGQMQDGVRAILHRLRPPQRNDGIEEALQHQLQVWQRHYPAVVVDATLSVGTAPLGKDLLQAVMRIVQEGLTNVARHAAATRVDFTLRRVQAGDDNWLEISLADNGRGLRTPSPAAGCGLGLAGMRERVMAFGGELRLEPGVAGGTRLFVRLPATQSASMEDS